MQNFLGFGQSQPPPDNIIIFCDLVLKRQHLDNLETAVLACFPTSPLEWISLTGGEDLKSLEGIAGIWEVLKAHHASRHTLIMAVGGGTVTDAVGFASSTFKRGLNWVAVPTTLLGMVDAAWGGKTGINWSGIKNMVGTFHPPRYVWMEPDWLETLPELEIWNGWMEMVKHSLIWGDSNWKELAQIQPTQTSPESLHALAAASAGIKRTIVEADPREAGVRKLLNFGHTVGHGLEALSQELTPDRPIPHGLAIGWGMAFSLELSQYRKQVVDPDIEAAKLRVLEWLKQSAYGEKPLFDPELIWSKMLHDKKNRQGCVLDILLDSIGDARYDVPIEKSEFVCIWDRLH